MKEWLQAPCFRKPRLFPCQTNLFCRFMVNSTILGVIEAHPNRITTERNCLRGPWSFSLSYSKLSEDTWDTYKFTSLKKKYTRKKQLNMWTRGCWQPPWCWTVPHRGLLWPCAHKPRPSCGSASFSPFSSALRMLVFICLASQTANSLRT